MGLPVGVELAVEKAGGVALEKNGEYRLERRDKRVYVIPRGDKVQMVDLAVRIDPGPPVGEGYRGQGGKQLPSPPTCELSRAGAGGSMMAPLETGAADFDGAVAIEVDHPDDVAILGSVLESEAVRAQVLALIETGAAVRMDAGPKAWLTARFSNTSKLEDVAQLDQVVERLLDLHAALPAFATSGVVRGTPGCGCLSAVALVAVSGIVFASATDLGMGSRTGELEIAAVLVSPLLFIAIVALAWLRLRRTGSRSLLIGIGMVSLVAAPMTCVGAARLINTVGVGTRVTHRVKVLDKGVVTRLRGSDSYWVDVTPWKPHTAPITLGLTPEKHEQVHTGSELRVTLGEGRLGYEWVDDVQLEEK